MRKHDSCPNSSHCFEHYKVLLSLDACVVRSLILDIQDYLRIRTELGVIMIVSPRVTLAVLVTLSVITDILVSASTFRRQNRRRVHKQRKRPRFGRQEELVKTTSPSSPSPDILPAPGVERYDLTSYGEARVDAPAIKYGAPGPEDDTEDTYAGDLPSVEDIGGVGRGGQDTAGVTGAASDIGDNSEAEDDANEVTRAQGIPPWCNPTDPMGAWLNHQKIQVIR